MSLCHLQWTLSVALLAARPMAVLNITKKKDKTLCLQDKLSILKALCLISRRLHKPRGAKRDTFPHFCMSYHVKCGQAQSPMQPLSLALLNICDSPSSGLGAEIIRTIASVQLIVNCWENKSLLVKEQTKGTHDP